MARSKEEVVQEFRIQTIRDAAMRVIARKGMASATMQEIADEAGIAKGTIYLYFRDRDELVEKTFESAMSDLHDRVEVALEKEGSFEEKLRAVLAAQIDYFQANREFFRLYISLRYPEGSAQQQRRQKRHCQPQYKSRVERIAGVLREAMARGEIRQLDPMRLALFIIEGSNAVIIERVLDEAPPPAEADIELIAGMILDGIRS
ncbi:MAG: TetR family transcriptional regulator [Acidobacteriota bacterium]